MSFIFKNPPKREVVGQITVEMYDRDGSNQNRRIFANVELRSQDGQIAGKWFGNLLTHLDQDQISDLVALLDWIRSAAEAQLLETP